MVELSWMSRRSIPTLGLLTSRVLVQKRCWVSRWTSVYATWRLDTCRHSTNPCPAFLVVVTYARLVVVNWTFHVSIWLCMEDWCLPMLVPHLGTLYLTVSRTLILLCKPSNAISRPSFFHILAHSVRLRFLTKTCYINPLLLLLLRFIYNQLSYRMTDIGNNASSSNSRKILPN